MIFLHHRTADTTAGADRHFDETVAELPVFDIFQRGNTVFRSVDHHIGIAGGVLRHGFQDTAGGGEVTGKTLIVRDDLFLRCDVFGLQPLGELFKRQYRVDDTAALFRFILFCHAWSDEYGFCLRMAPFDIHTMGMHRCYNISQIFEQGREIFADQQVYRMAAG